MKEKKNSGIENNLLFNFDKLQNNYIDKEKLALFSKDIQLGIDNYFLFQNFFNFKWPLWLYNTYSVKSIAFNPIKPFLLLNNNNRDWISFKNGNLANHCHVDPSGMISPLTECWSIELWLAEKGIFHRAQERIDSVFQEKNIDTFIINTKWKETNFEIVESIYGIDNETDDLAVEISTTLQKSNLSACLLITIRPYNLVSLGGVNSINFNSKTRAVEINDIDKIYLGNNPDFIFTGNMSSGDIEYIPNAVKTESIKCNFGMATMALGFSLSKGVNEYRMGVNLSARKKIDVVKLDYTKLKSSYIEKCNLKSRNGLKITFPEKNYQNWINSAKVTSLNFGNYNKEKSPGLYSEDIKSIFYIISACNRLGLFPESINILESIGSKIKAKEKLSPKNISDRCYYLNSVSDYFRISRDIDYLRVKYKHLRELIFPIINYSHSFKANNLKYNNNSLENYFIREFHIIDLLLISYTFTEISYLARCLGIFNDEKKFNKEIARLEVFILRDLKSTNTVFPEDNTGKENIEAHIVSDNSLEIKNFEQNEKDEYNVKETLSRYRNEFFSYNVFAGYPFRINSLPVKDLKAIIDKVSASFSENPLYFKTIGAGDLFFSIIFAANLLLVKDSRVHVIINKLFEIGKAKYILPDFINPKTGSGIRGEGDSLKVLSCFACLLRSVIFIDSEEKLDIFPVPKAEWFMDGSEIKIQDAPSIFGLLNFRVVSTKNEVQFHFSGLPKYLPPNIVLNLPFKAKIKQEDDFIIKKESGNSYVIHGWPSLVRCIKK